MEPRVERKDYPWCNKYLFALFISRTLHPISIFHPKEIWEMFCLPIESPKIFLIWPVCTGAPWGVKTLCIMEEIFALYALTSNFTRGESLEEIKVRVGISKCLPKAYYNSSNVRCVWLHGWFRICDAIISQSAHPFIYQAVQCLIAWLPSIEAN